MKGCKRVVTQILSLVTAFAVLTKLGPRGGGGLQSFAKSAAVSGSDAVAHLQQPVAWTQCAERAGAESPTDHEDRLTAVVHNKPYVPASDPKVPRVQIYGGAVATQNAGNISFRM